MVNIKYTRVISEFNPNNPYMKWIENNLAIAFLKQQLFLLAVIASSILILIVTALFNSEPGYEQDLQGEVRYGVVVDCGSSGTRAHIFRWLENGDQQLISRIELARDGQKRPLNKHIVPGLSTFSNKPDNASDYMEPIMDFISEVVPYDRHMMTPIYFMATAGMRLLRDESRKKILNDITKDLRAKYNFPKIKSQVITGQYEGTYSWMSVNVDRFYNETKARSNSVGIIEMGGASVQVTFELGDETERAILDNIGDSEAWNTFRSEQVKLEIPKNKSVKLFATSFLGLGVNSARDYAVDFIVRDYFNGTGQLGKESDDSKGFAITLQDPCLPIGSNETTIRPTEIISDAHRSLGFTTDNHSDVLKVKLMGSGNFLNCLTLLERVIKAIKEFKLNCQPSKTCPLALLGTDFIPFRNHDFVGLSEMYFTTNEIMKQAGSFNRSRVLRETNRICSAGYDQLQLDSRGVVTHEDRILHECFKATWLLTVLHNSGLKMPVEYGGFDTIDRLDGQEIDWTMGAMLWETLSKQRSV